MIIIVNEAIELLVAESKGVKKETEKRGKEEMRIGKKNKLLCIFTMLDVRVINLRLVGINEKTKEY